MLRVALCYGFAGALLEKDKKTHEHFVRDTGKVPAPFSLPKVRNSSTPASFPMYIHRKV